MRVGLAALLLILVAGAATAQTLPQQGQAIHLGVATCGGSTCHGSPQPWKTSMVLQNEFVTWSTKDRHAKAYGSLVSVLGKRIAANLGLPNAHEAKVCLDCHADNVGPERRSKQFALTDGVTCESCHGGAERWLGQHVSGTGGHAENVAAGMFPTESPAARARLCLSCHLGDETKSVTHRLLGAGHPRLRFELDTFTAAQPAHFRVDDDYNKRKPAPTGVQVWAVGQAVQVQQFMAALADPLRNRDGRFPELAFFDCQACHHRTDPKTVLPRAPLSGRSNPRLNESSLAILQVIAERTRPDLGLLLARQTASLRTAMVSSLPALQAAAQAISGTAAHMADHLGTHAFLPEDYAGLLAAVLDQAEVYGDYASAEQATMAVSSIVAEMDRAGLLNEQQKARMQAELDRAYKAVDSEIDFTGQKFVATIQDIARNRPATPRSAPAQRSATGTAARP